MYRLILVNSYRNVEKIDQQQVPQTPKKHQPYENIVDRQEFVDRLSCTSR